MNKIVLSFLTLLFSCSCTQKNADHSHQDVRAKLDQFFKAIDAQNPELFKEAVDLHGQAWVVNNDTVPAKVAVRTFKDAVENFDPSIKIIEKPLSVEIKIHNGLASAWVPYKLWVNGQFSHCGVDAFILVEREGGWKIVSIAYTKDTVGCDEL